MDKYWSFPLCISHILIQYQGSGYGDELFTLGRGGMTTEGQEKELVLKARTKYDLRS